MPAGREAVVAEIFDPLYDHDKGAVQTEHNLLPFRGHGHEESFQFLMVNLRNISFFSSALSSGQCERLSD
jgi:hypothetical protein